MKYRLGALSLTCLVAFVSGQDCPWDATVVMLDQTIGYCEYIVECYEPRCIAAQSEPGPYAQCSSYSVQGTCHVFSTKWENGMCVKDQFIGTVPNTTQALSLTACQIDD